MMKKRTARRVGGRPGRWRGGKAWPVEDKIMKVLGTQCRKR